MTLKAIPEKYHDLLKDETKAFLYLATVMDDGTPQNTPVWFNHDDEYILINSAKGRVKDHNMRQRPDVACLILDPADPYRYVQIRGRVVEITEEGGTEHINQLNAKYTSRDKYPLPEGQIRVIYKIRPHSIDEH
jgi:PPOX class probable F420-dependent enzyme